MRKIYLGVGINETAAGSVTPLRMCVSDIEFACHYFEASGYEIIRLHEENASQAAIIKTLFHCVSEINKEKEPSILVYHHSSHGLQVRDSDSDEPDAMDEAVVCYDTTWSKDKGDWDCVITDDIFHRLFSAVSPRHLMLAIFDTCHSGSMSREIVVNRRYAYRKDGKDVARPHRTFLTKKYGLSATAKECAGGFIPTSNNYVLLCAASSDGYAYEDHKGGLLSRSFVHLLMNSEKPMARRCLIKRIIREIHAKGYESQTPHYECMRSKMKQRELTVQKEEA